METNNYKELEWGFGIFSESSNKMPIDGSFEVTLPEDPFSMKVRLAFNTFSDWLQMESFDWFSKNDLEALPEDPFCMASVDEEPHEAFDLVLPYLGIEDILAIEGVCRSLRNSVRKESFLWRSIDLSDSPLKFRVNDDSLVNLTCRAQGELQSLNLGGCVGITDNGLMQVLKTNPGLSKLCISGCLGLSTTGMLSILRDLKSSDRLGIKSIITGGALYFTNEQFKELNLLLLGGEDGKASMKSRRQRLYTSSRSEFSLEDDGVIDIEICPWCDKPSLVFDCASETCPKPSSCRACVVCIERCHDCGSCLNDSEHKPFCFAFSCVLCYKKRSSQLQDLL